MFYAEVGMIALVTIPVQVSEEAAQYMEQMGLQEPYERIVAEIPRRIQGVHWIKVGLEHIWDEPGRSIVGFDVARVYPGRNDPSRREFAGWEIETFPPEVLEHLVVNVTYVAPHAG